MQMINGHNNNSIADDGILIAPSPNPRALRPSLSMWTLREGLGLAWLVHIVKKGVPGNNRWERERIHKRLMMGLEDR
jgi:hypothetical protein